MDMGTLNDSYARGNIAREDMVVSPLTKEPECTFIEDVQIGKLINDWKNIFSIDVTKEFGNYEKVSLFRCDKTKLRFFLPSTIAGSEHLYAQLQKFEWFYMPWKWEHDALFSRLKKGEKILEVGCATGAFIEKVCSSGFEAEGIELNSSAVAIAKSKNLNVSETDLFELAKAKPGQFDVVCSFQVLEHVSDPAHFIKCCIALLKSKGRLVICVPNNDSFLKYQFNILDMPPHHMTQWSVSTFQALERLYPLCLTCVKYEALAYYHVDGYLFSHQKRLLAISSMYRLLLNHYSIPVIRFALKSGLRRFCRGQSIYVELVKL
jgi:2-polyprenyl-3-methyl-5-hydroxy-6-metoxy-1,4-benzoquinol methylase